MYYACHCPLAKIFQKEFTVEHIDDKGKKTYEIVTQADLMRNPERIFKEEAFSIRIERSQGDLQFRYAQPRLYSDPDIANWISGGADGMRVQETECYGIVRLPLEDEVIGFMQYLATSGKQAPKDLTAALQKSQETAKELSKMRVMRAVRSVHDALQKQYKLVDEQKLGRYQPSPVEFMCAYVLAEEEMKKSADSKKLTDRFAELMRETAVMTGV